MEQMLGKIFNCYGTAMTLRRGQEQFAIRGFLQPVRSRSRIYLEGDYSPLGEIPRGRFVYIGPPSPAARADDLVILGEHRYLLRQAELIYSGDSPVYCWGMCIEEGGEDQWGRQL